MQPNRQPRSIATVARNFLSQAGKLPPQPPNRVAPTPSESVTSVLDEQEAALFEEDMPSTVLLADHLGDVGLITQQYLQSRSGCVDSFMALDGAEDRLDQLLNRCDRVVVACRPEPDDVVATYKKIKWLGTRLGRREQVYLFVADARSIAVAESTYEKLAGATEKFMGMELGYEGCCLSEGDAVSDEPGDSEWTENLIGQQNHSPKTPCSQEEAKPDFASDKLSSVEACAALGDERERACLASTAGGPPPAVHRTISVETLPTTDAALSDALQLALPGWLTALPTAMAVPLDLPSNVGPHIRVLFDAAGRFHILTARLSGDQGLLAEALMARKWLVENLDLLTTHCRHFSIDRRLPTGIVLVAGAAVANTLRAAAAQIEGFPCHVMQLHLLQGETKPALLVV